jgi:hypothetical protein
MWVCGVCVCVCVCVAIVIICCGYVDEATGDGVSPQHLFRNRRGRMVDANTQKQQRTHTDADTHTNNEQTVVVVLPPRLISAHLAPKAQVYADISNPHMFPHPHTHTHMNADTVGTYTLTHTLPHTQTHTQTGTYTLASAPTLLQYTRRWLLRTREHKRLRTLFRTVRGLRAHTVFTHTWRRVFTEHRQWRLCVCRRAFAHIVACLRTHIRGKQRAAQAYRLLQCGRALQKLFVNAQLHTQRHTHGHTHRQRSKHEHTHSQVDSRHTLARTQTHTPAHTQSRVASKSDVGVVGKLLDSMQSAAHTSKFAALLQFHANRLSAPSGAHTHSTLHSSAHSATHTTRQTAGTHANTHTGTRQQQQQQPSRRAHTQTHTQTHTQSKPGRTNNRNTHTSYGDSDADGDDYEDDFVDDEDTSTFARTHSSPGTQQTHIGSGSTTPMFARRHASGRGGTAANTSSMMTMDDLDNTSTIASITSNSFTNKQHQHQQMRRGGGLSAHTSSSSNSSSNSNSMGPAQQADNADNADDDGPMSILDSYCLFNRLKAALYRLHTHARLRTHIHAALTHVETHHLTSALHHWQTWSTEHKQTRILHTKRLSHSFEHWKMCVVHKKHTLAFKRRWFVYMKSRRLGGVLLKYKHKMIVSDVFGVCFQKWKSVCNSQRSRELCVQTKHDCLLVNYGFNQWFQVCQSLHKHRQMLVGKGFNKMSYYATELGSFRRLSRQPALIARIRKFTLLMRWQTCVYNKQCEKAGAHKAHRLYRRMLLRRGVSAVKEMHAFKAAAKRVNILAHKNMNAVRQRLALRQLRMRCEVATSLLSRAHMAEVMISHSHDAYSAVDVSSVRRLSRQFVASHRTDAQMFGMADELHTTFQLRLAVRHWLTWVNQHRRSKVYSKHVHTAAEASSDVDGRVQRAVSVLSTAARLKTAVISSKLRKGVLVRRFFGYFADFVADQQRHRDYCLQSLRKYTWPRVCTALFLRVLLTKQCSSADRYFIRRRCAHALRNWRVFAVKRGRVNICNRRRQVKCDPTMDAYASYFWFQKCWSKLKSAAGVGKDDMESHNMIVISVVSE